MPLFNVDETPVSFIRVVAADKNVELDRDTETDLIVCVVQRLRVLDVSGHEIFAVHVEIGDADVEVFYVVVIVVPAVIESRQSFVKLRIRVQIFFQSRKVEYARDEIRVFE